MCIGPFQALHPRKVRFLVSPPLPCLKYSVAPSLWSCTLEQPHTALREDSLFNHRGCGGQSTGIEIFWFFLTSSNDMGMTIRLEASRSREKKKKLRYTKLATESYCNCISIQYKLNKGEMKTESVTFCKKRIQFFDLHHILLAWVS